jgi:hypothetical protein|tara:strand:+ start:23009 stop:23338 length:330 start_codon:yes stop_codon:yes gene_type:complete
MEIIIWIFAAYGMSQILVYGSIFDNLRTWITRKSKFFGDLLSCMMCTSTWVGFFFSLAFFSPTVDLISIPYTNIFFDGMFASGGVWAINAIVEWYEENKPKKKDEDLLL